LSKESERKTTPFRPSKLPPLSILYSGVSWGLSRGVFSSPIQERGPGWRAGPNTTRPMISECVVICPQSAAIFNWSFQPLTKLMRHQAMETKQAESLALYVPISARLLILKIHGELDYAGAEILDRLTISGKWNGACAEKRIDCGSTRMVEKVEDLCD
jgi:hypothetical protein